jgi:flagellar hook-associated protein 3 FlgL
MYTRVTQRSIAATALANLQGNLDRIGKTQQQLSSGRLISTPSDSPTGTVTSLQLRSQVRSYEQYSRNAEDGLGWLGTIDTALTDAAGQVHRARDLLVQGMSTGVQGLQAREAIAAEIDQLRDGLIQAGNTTYLDRPVFGGTTAGKLSYDTTGAYIGDGGLNPDGTPTSPVYRTLGETTTLRVDISGPEVFGTGSTQLFTVLADIRDHLTSDPSLLKGDLDRLDAARTNLQNMISDIGARSNRVSQLRQGADDQILTLKSSLSNVENIDLPKTITELQMQQVAYEAALGATAKAIQPSLLDFLR